MVGMLTHIPSAGCQPSVSNTRTMHPSFWSDNTAIPWCIAAEQRASAAEKLAGRKERSFQGGSNHAYGACSTLHVCANRVCRPGLATLQLS